MIDCFIAIDSGMGRIGYRIETPLEKEFARTEIEEIDELEGLRINGMVSHFATLMKLIRRTRTSNFRYLTTSMRNSQAAASMFRCCV